MHVLSYSCSSVRLFFVYTLQNQIEALSLESLKASADEYREHFSRALGRAIQGTIKVCGRIHACENTLYASAFAMLKYIYIYVVALG